MTRWTDHDRAKALAALEMNEGNVARTAREVGIPRPTIASWRDTAIEAGQALPMPADGKTDWTAVREEAGQLCAANALTAAQIVRDNLAKLKDTDLKVGDLQRVAIIGGIQTDKAYDLLVGRRGGDINVDARSVHYPALEALTSDELRAIVAHWAPDPETSVVAPTPIRPGLQAGGPGT